MSVTVHRNEPEERVGDLIMDHLSRGGVDSPVCLEYIRFDPEEGTFQIECATGMKVVVSATFHNGGPHFDVRFA